MRSLEDKIQDSFCEDLDLKYIPDFEDGILSFRGNNFQGEASVCFDKNKRNKTVTIYSVSSSIKTKGIAKELYKRLAILSKQNEYKYLKSSPNLIFQSADAYRYLADLGYKVKILDTMKDRFSDLIKLKVSGKKEPYPPAFVDLDNKAIFTVTL